MFFLLSYLIFTKVLCILGSNAGSTIFYNRFSRSRCWNEDDIAKLRARRLFEQLVPSPITPERINSKYIKDTLHYFHQALNSVKQYDENTSIMLKEALADTIGAHLRSEVLPTARFAYYAGYVPYKRVRELHDFYDNIKTILNTQGLGWKAPASVPKWSNLTVAKILIGNGKYFDSCGCLVMKRDFSSCIHLPLPKLDNEKEPSALFLPLKTDGLVSLTSPTSENILLKYYTTASRCILNNSPASCRHTDFVNFNNEIWHWMKRDVSPHLGDEKFYAAYGGVFRIAAAVQSYGKGLTRRNLLETQNNWASKWHPWKAVKGGYASAYDWTPCIYVGIVLLAALSICLMQICFNFISGDEEACTWREHPRGCPSKEVAYATIESNIPAMLPTHQNVFYSEEKHASRAQSNSKTMSLGSLRTQKVYDLNENAEKIMTVLSEEDSTENSTSSTSKDGEGKSVTDPSRSKRDDSPPKIDSSISHVHLLKRGKNAKARPLLSMTTVTRSEGSEVESSGSSGQSESSATSKSRCRRSRRCRDLDWAQRVVSKTTLQRKSISGTEADTSMTTRTYTGVGSDSLGYYF